ncbi:HAD family phosphatase [Psychromarinibacter sp. C21-152]|uniref:HAD family phosphatase n=1 Tax=Psychromarinibacter sediminicola TaxID=3033385 RepID=A0AAE3T848_9RHOB|nr:HAD family phosphatase [Psychromarinibacter sediminicola]MDF0600877.1 HAD family phosphatase [Psychromarinibacter sediminicola]
MGLALLFDLDGTLLDSDPIHEAVFADLWRDHGRQLEEGFYQTHVHGRLNADIFRAHLPEVADPEALSAAKEAEFRRRLPRPYPATPGAAALLDRAAARGWKVAVVTNAMRPNAEAMLEATGLRHHFEVLVIGEECPRGKPDPYPYSEAMRQLGAAPADCIAFEDSPSGVRSAAGAGARVVGIRSSLTDAALKAAGATLTLKDFTDPALEPLLDAPTGALA